MNLGEYHRQLLDYRELMEEYYRIMVSPPNRDDNFPEQSKEKIED